MYKKYEWRNKFWVENAIGLGLAIGNVQPRSKYKTAYWQVNILVLCFCFEIGLLYSYSPPQVEKKQ